MMPLSLAVVVVSPSWAIKYKRVTQSGHQDSPPAKKSFLDAMATFMEAISKTIIQPETSQGSNCGPCAIGHNYQVLGKEKGVLFSNKCGTTLTVPKQTAELIKLIKSSSAFVV